MKRNVESHHGGYIVNGYLVQFDWDLPGVAQGLGWHLARVQRRGREIVELSRRSRVGCQHTHTDGTVNCDCGVTASDFIRAAAHYLDSLC